MKIAFLIVAHQYPELLARLVKRLQSPVASLFIHLDKNSDIRPFQDVFLREGLHDVHWVPRVSCRWGTFDQVKASLVLLREAMAQAKEAGMFLLLSGQDYPLMRPEAMAGFFAQRPGTSFVRWAKLPWSNWSDDGGFERLTHYHFVFRGHQLEIPTRTLPVYRRVLLLYYLCRLILPSRRKLPADVTFYGGFNWWNLSREDVRYVLDFIEKNPGFSKPFRFTRSSDEIFFQTILLNSGKPPPENTDLRCVFWDGRREEYPAVLRPEEFEEIKASSAFFARKIHPARSLALIDRIDRELLGWS